MDFFFKWTVVFHGYAMLSYLKWIQMANMMVYGDIDGDIVYFHVGGLEYIMQIWK